MTGTIAATFDRRTLIRDLTQVVGSERILYDAANLLVYESDALTIFKGRPDFVVFPETTQQVAKIVEVCRRVKVPFVARGAGTGLSGGSISIGGGVLIELSRMNQILDVDIPNETVVVQPGVVNIWVTEAVSKEGYFFAPDPSSQTVSTIGGNVSHNSGGPHTLKYGVTANHVLGVELVLPTGEVVEFGGKAVDLPGYDLTGLTVGSEGTLGIVTKAVLRVLRRPHGVRTMVASFETLVDGSNAVSEIVASGITPAAVELMDKLTVVAIEASHHAAGYPTDAGAVIIVELDGPEIGLDEELEKVISICKRNKARTVRIAADEEERKKIWAGRKGSFAAMGRLGRAFVVQDGVIPRTKLPEIVARVEQIARQYNVKIANVFHAGDGNLHPLIVYDPLVPGEKDRALAAGAAVIRTCVEAGGTITGEHGVGIDKRDFFSWIYSEDDMEVMHRFKCVFNPDGLCNPGKILPRGSRCSEMYPLPGTLSS